MRTCHRSRAAWALLALAAALSASCRAPSERRYTDELAETSAGAAHAVHDWRLAEVMRNLDALRSARLPTSLDPREERERRASEVARVASAMADAADRIPGAAPSGLDARARAEFAQIASELSVLCRSLAAEAGTARPEVLAQRLDDIDATCTRCHERFRIPGPGDVRDED